MKSALLVIDVQRDFFDGESKPFDAKNVIQNINLATAKARKSQIPVIFIQHENKKSKLEYNTEKWQLSSDLIIEKTDVFIRKTTPDSFLRTDLSEYLKSNKITNLLICGYATEFCVDTTTRRAAALGYPVQLLSDAHTTDDKKHATAKQIRVHHNATLSSISSFAVSIKAVETALIEI